MPPSPGNRGLIGGLLRGQWWLMTSKSCENPLPNNLCARLGTWLTLQDGNQFIHAVLVAQNLEQNRVRNMGYVCDMYVTWDMYVICICDMYVICGFLFLGLESHGMMSLDLQHLGFFSGKSTNTKRTLSKINCLSTIHELTHINIEICL